MGAGQQLVGGLVTLGIGVIVIAAIFQLNKTPTGVAQDASTSYQKTLTSLFS